MQAQRPTRKGVRVSPERWPKPFAIGSLLMPVLPAYHDAPCLWPQSILFGQTGFIITLRGIGKISRQGDHDSGGGSADLAQGDVPAKSGCVVRFAHRGEFRNATVDQLTQGTNNLFRNETNWVTHFAEVISAKVGDYTEQRLSISRSHRMQRDRLSCRMDPNEVIRLGMDVLATSRLRETENWCRRRVWLLQR